jgi:hypothetical protein
MASQQINKKRLSKPVPQGRVPPQGHAQCEVRVKEKQCIERKTGQVKSIVSPGSISAYMQMKERRMKDNQIREKHSGGSHQQLIVQKSHEGGSTKSLGSHLQQEPFDNDFQTNYNYIMDSNECDRDDLDGEDSDLLRNGSLIIQEIENEQCDGITLFFVIVLKLLYLYVVSLVILFYNLCMLLCSTFKREAN